MALVNIKTVVNAAEERGFQVKWFTDFGGGVSAHVRAPDHQDRGDGWHEGCQYSTADFVISDRPGTGYGYNHWFAGPWHSGHCQDDAPGLQKLLAHPAMRAS